MRFILLFILRFYKLCVSPFFGVACRFAPSCSDYAQEAIEQHGAVKGTMLAAKRVARCHPWGASGFDPVPEAK